MPLPFFVNLLISVGASFIASKLFAPDPPTVDDPGDKQRSRADPEAPLDPLFGKWQTYGKEIYLGANTSNSIGYYAVALGVIPEGGTISFDKVLIEDTVATLDANGNVTSAVDPNGNAVDKFNGRIRVIRYAGGRSSFLEGAVTDWTSTFTGTGIVYAAISVDRDREAGIVALPEMRFTGSCSIDNPADAVLQMLTDDRFGLNKSMDKIGDSFAAHRAYCNEMVAHTASGGGSVSAKRYTVDGAIKSGQDDVITRCEKILAHQNASLGYHNGKYEIFTNKATTASGIAIDEDWLLGGIEFSETASSLFTDLKITYGPNEANKYQRNETYVTVPSGLRKPGQQYRLSTLPLPYCVSSVQADRVAAIWVNEAYVGLTIRIEVDVRGIQLVPQQLVTVTSEKYSLSAKQFIVKEIDEIESSNGRLSYRITLREYAAASYVDSTIADQDPAPNVNITDPSVIQQPYNVATSAVNTSATVPNFTLSWQVPAGLVDEFVIYTSPSSLFSGATEYARIRSTTSTYTTDATISHIVSGLPAGIYYFFVVGRNSFGQSPASASTQITWAPQVTSTGLVVSPEWSKDAIVVSEGSSGTIDLTNATASLFILVSGQKATLTTASTLTVNNTWRLVSGVGSGGVTEMSVADTGNNEIDVTVTGFTSNGSVTVNYQYRNDTGDISNLLAALDVTEAPGGDDAQGVQYVTIYRKNSSTISTSSGTFANPLTGNSDWSFGVPSISANGDNIYASTRIFTDDGLSPQQSAWTTPVVAYTRVDGQTVTGPAGQSTRTATIYRKNSNTISNTSGTFANPLTGNTSWSFSVPAITTNGDVIYSSTRLLTSDGLTPQESSWSTPTVAFTRVDGQTVQGPAGQTIRTVNIYRKNSSTIASTSGSFANPLTGNTSWSINVPAITTDGDDVYVSTRVFTSDGLTPQESSWSTPVVAYTRVDGQTVQGPAGQGIRTPTIYRKNSSTISSTSGTFANPLASNSNWSYSVPAITADGDIIYSSTRILTSDAASPQENSWSTPSIAYRRVDGQTVQGPAGQSARTPSIYRKNSATISSSSGTFANPLTGNSSWSYSVPSLTANGDIVYVSTRTFTSDAASPQDSNWSTPAIYSRRTDGASVTGPDGPRGPGRFHIPVSSLPTSSAAAETQFLANGTGTASVTPSSSVINDQAWFYTGSVTSPTSQVVWLKTTSSVWTKQTEVIDGSLLVSDTVTADAMAANSIGAEQLTVSENTSAIYTSSPTSSTSGTASSGADGIYFNSFHNRIEIWDSGILRVVLGGTQNLPSNNP